MAWLRIDDGFAQHPKVVSLTPRDRWTWLEILCYCARYRTDGHVPASVKEVVRGATISFLERAETLGLLEQDLVGDYLVHDWEDYNGRDPKILVTERKRRQRGHEDVTATSRQSHADVPPPGRDKNVTRAQPRARVPVPNPNPTPLTEGSEVVEIKNPTPKPELHQQPQESYEEAVWRRALDNGAGWSRDYTQLERIQPDLPLPTREPEGGGK